MIEIAIQAQGVGMEEAVLLKWHKQPGDSVSEGEPVAEIETDKATMDLESPASGVLGQHLVSEDEVVPVGKVVVRILEAGEVEAEHAVSTETVAAEPPSGDPPASDSGDPPSRKPQRLSPRARSMQREAEADASVPSEETTEGRFRAKIAAKVTESWQTIPHFAVAREVRADSLLARVAEMKATVPGLKVTDLLLRALAVAAEVDEVGLAVATDQGVMIPVIRDVLRTDLGALAADRSAAVERARANELEVSDLGSPETTLSNLGPMGVDSFTGIVALGQQSLLTVGSSMPRVVATPEGPEVQTTFHATLNADHRILDGADVAKQLATFAEVIESSGDVVEVER